MIKRPKFRSLRLVACYELIPFLSVPRKPILNHLSGCTSTSAEPLLRQAPAWLRTVRNRRRFFTATPSHTLTVASVCPHAAASALPVHLLDALLPQAELHLHMHLDSAAHRVLVTEEDPGQDPSRNSPPPAETHNLLLSVGRGEAHHPGPGVEIVLRHCYYVVQLLRLSGVFGPACGVDASLSPTTCHIDTQLSTMHSRTYWTSPGDWTVAQRHGSVFLGSWLRGVAGCVQDGCVIVITSIWSRQPLFSLRHRKAVLPRLAPTVKAFSFLPFRL
ncbi:hypothetical protein IWX91DRAFT_94265 [Phyllosticta citricarpa]